MQKLHQAELILAPTAAEFYLIHALAYEVQAEAPRPDIFKRAAAHLLRIRRDAAIFQQDLKSIRGLTIARRTNPMEGSLDGPSRVSEVSMSDDIGHGFINRKYDRTAFRLGKSQRLGELSQSVSHHAQHRGIAPQFQFE
jgi:hypothetical protein